MNEMFLQFDYEDFHNQALTTVFDGLSGNEQHQSGTLRCNGRFAIFYSARQDHYFKLDLPYQVAEIRLRLLETFGCVFERKIKTTAQLKYPDTTRYETEIDPASGSGK